MVQRISNAYCGLFACMKLITPPPPTPHKGYFSITSAMNRNKRCLTIILQWNLPWLPGLKGPRSQTKGFKKLNGSHMEAKLLLKIAIRSQNYSFCFPFFYLWHTGLCLGILERNGEAYIHILFFCVRNGIFKNCLMYKNTESLL